MSSAPSSPRGRSSYGSGARVLSLGIAVTGLLTFAYFAVASHVLGAEASKRIDVLWSVMFVTVSVIYRPIEQLLSRTIAARRARGGAEERLLVPIAIQAAFALVFALVALVLRGRLVKALFDGHEALFWVLLLGTIAYGASYFARGWLAGHSHFGLYGALVLMEALSRICFALAVALGIASGETAVALGMAAAPLLSLIVVPAGFASTAHARAAKLASAPITVDEAEALLSGPATEAAQEALAHEQLSLRRGAGFAFSVATIMLAEQTLLNAGVLTVAATSQREVLAGIVFNVLLIARAPLQLFQAIQTSLLPHLTGLEASAGRAAFASAIRVTVLSITAFAALVVLALLALGPQLMAHLFGQHYSYGRFGLALMGVGVGLHLTAGALNQAALARDRARAAAACWLAAAGLFLAWMLAPLEGDELLRAELGYAGATLLLALGLAALYRRGSPSALRGR